MKVIIELPSWLGDTIMVSPAIENLADYYKDLEISLIGSSVAIQVLKNHPRVTKAYELERSYFDLFSSFNSFGEYDLFVSFRSSFRSKILKFLISAKKKYQFDKNKFCSGHQVEKYNNFINESLNIESIPGRLVVHFDGIKEKKEEKKTKLLGINPGASYGSAKRWYPKKFAELASKLSKEYDLVIFGGPDELDIAKDIERYLIKRGVKNYQNQVSKTSIGDLITEVSNLDLFITGDSGPMHIAAALQIPTISIFGPTNHNATSQWMNEKSNIVKKKLECQPCMKRTCPLHHHNCMKLVEVSDVLESINQLN